MALIGTIRKHAGLTAGIVAGGLVLFFVGGDILRLPTFSGSQNTSVGKIAGKKVDIKAYQEQIDKMRHFTTSDADMSEKSIRDQAWEQLVTHTVLQKECEAVGLQVSEEELIDMVQGDHIHPSLQNFFQNPETKQFDKQQLLNYLQELPKTPAAQQARWRSFEREIADLRNQQKVAYLMYQSIFATDLEVKFNYSIMHTTLGVKCLYVPYYTYPDEELQITDSQLQEYLKVHKNAYQIEESRSIKYIAFSSQPTSEDRQAFQEELQALKQAFIQAQDPCAFARMNTDGLPSMACAQLTAEELPNALAQREKKLKKGDVIGPIQEGDSHKLYKIVALKSQIARAYEIAIIEKQLVPGDQARDQAFRKADYCANTIRNTTQLEAYAAQEALQVHEVQAGTNDGRVGNLAQARPLVRWLYNDAAINKVSPVLELGNHYVVAVMTKRVPAGTAPLAQVRDEIALKLRNEQKAQRIMEQLQQTTGTTLEEKVEQYGDEARLIKVNELSFSDDTLQSAGMARRVIGAAFALRSGARATVADDNGVFIVEVINRNTADPPRLWTMEQKRMTEQIQAKQSNDLLQALEELAQVKDERYRFY